MEYLFLFKFLNNKMSILSILSLIEPKPHHLEIIKKCFSLLLCYTKDN